MTTTLGEGLALSQGTDFFLADELLTEAERAVRDRVRAFVDDRLVPVANGYWERAEFPREPVAPYAELRVAGGSVAGLGRHHADRRPDPAGQPAGRLPDVRRHRSLPDQGPAGHRLGGLGHATGAYECALAYAKRREQFGRPIASFQLVQDKLSHMLSDITGMQLTCLRLAQLQDQGKVRLEHAALAKLQTASGARRVCTMARDILGGNGTLLEHHVARHHADMEAVYTHEGTDTVQSLIVGRAVTGHAAFM